MNKISIKLLNEFVKMAIKSNSNSTTSLAAYQPKAPASLKKFSKIDK